MDAWIQMNLSKNLSGILPSSILQVLLHSKFESHYFIFKWKDEYQK